MAFGFISSSLLLYTKARFLLSYKFFASTQKFCLNLSHFFFPTRHCHGVLLLGSSLLAISCKDRISSLLSLTFSKPYFPPSPSLYQHTLLILLPSLIQMRTNVVDWHFATRFVAPVDYGLNELSKHPKRNDKGDDAVHERSGSV